MSQASGGGLARRVSLAEIPMYWVAAKAGDAELASCLMAHLIGAVL